MKYITVSHAAHILGLGSRQLVDYYYVKNGKLTPIWISQGYKGAVRLFDKKEVEALAFGKLEPKRCAFTLNEVDNRQDKLDK